MADGVELINMRNLADAEKVQKILDEIDLFRDIIAKDRILKFIEEEISMITNQVEMNERDSDLLTTLSMANRYLKQIKPTEDVKLLLEKRERTMRILSKK